MKSRIIEKNDPTWIKCKFVNFWNGHSLHVKVPHEMIHMVVESWKLASTRLSEATTKKSILRTQNCNITKNETVSLVVAARCVPVVSRWKIAHLLLSIISQSGLCSKWLKKRMSRGSKLSLLTFATRILNCLGSRHPTRGKHFEITGRISRTEASRVMFVCCKREVSTQAQQHKLKLPKQNSFHHQKAKLPQSLLLSLQWKIQVQQQLPSHQPRKIKRLSWILRCPLKKLILAHLILSQTSWRKQQHRHHHFRYRYLKSLSCCLHHHPSIIAFHHGHARIIFISRLNVMRKLLCRRLIIRECPLHHLGKMFCLLQCFVPCVLHLINLLPSPRRCRPTSTSTIKHGWRTLDCPLHPFLFLSTGTHQRQLPYRLLCHQL